MISHKSQIGDTIQTELMSEVPIALGGIGVGLWGLKCVPAIDHQINFVVDRDLGNLREDIGEIAEPLGESILFQS